MYSYSRPAIKELFAIALLFAANLSAASASVTFGDEFCQTIRFPATWRVLDSDKPVENFEFRAGSTGEYLVAAINPGSTAGARKYSTNKYWVNLSSGRVRPARESEWNASTPLPAAERFRAGLPRPNNSESFVFWQTPFPKSGPNWPVSSLPVRISPDEHWIAVLSWLGRDYRDEVGINSLAPLGVATRFFVDIFEVASGGRVVAIDGVDRDFNAGDMALADSFWLGSDHLVVPLGFSRQKLLVCEIPVM